MGRISGSDEDQDPRLFVVLVSDEERRSVIEGFPDEVRVVGRQEISAAVSAEVEARSIADAEVIRELEEDLRSLVTRQASNEAIHADLLVEQRRTREAADWCESQPAQDRADHDDIAMSAQTLDTHSRIVRDANRQLERMLEQRAAAEAALEEARSELGSLGSAGADETDVRRQMEVASRRMHEVTAEYQACMTEVARCKAAVWDLEDAAASTAAAATVDSGDDARHDPLRAMSAVVNAKFSSGDTTVTVADPEAMDRARASLQSAEERADEVSDELAVARSTLSSLENELVARTRETDSREARQAAALELESQVAAVESQLGEAEAKARAEVEDATRAMSRAELSLERLRQDARDRRRQLQTFAALMPEEERPPSDDDPVDHAAAIARSLRTHADAMQPDVDHALDTVDADRAKSAGKEAALDDRRARLHVAVGQDGVTAIEELARGRLALAIDDAVAIDDSAPSIGDGVLSTSCLLDVETDTPVIVLTLDTSIAGWAIELPAERGAMTSVASLRSMGHLLVGDLGARS